MKKKITVNEIKKIVSQVLKEQLDPYSGSLDAILSDIQKLKSPITGRAPRTFIRNGVLFVSAEDGNYFADYDGEFKGPLYIDPRLVSIAKKYDMYWEWENAGSIALWNN